MQSKDAKSELAKHDNTFTNTLHEDQNELF